jgi:hypothetical protein
MSDQNRGQMSSGVLKASDGQRNFIKREKTPQYIDFYCNVIILNRDESQPISFNLRQVIFQSTAPNLWLVEHLRMQNMLPLVVRGGSKGRSGRRLFF